MNLSRTVIDPVTRSSLVDRLMPVYDRLSQLVADRPDLARMLRGNDLGHAVHPMLTDLPLGLWTSTTVLDLIGGRKSHRAAGLLCGLGVITAAPTAAAGLADYRALEGDDRRVAVAHAAGNSAGVLLYAASFKARLRGHHLRGALDALLGATCVSAAGYLGGHLALNRGTANREDGFHEGLDSPTSAQQDWPTHSMR